MTRFSATRMVVLMAMWCAAITAEEATQYAFEEIKVPAATADEPRLAKLDIELASKHLEQGAIAWNGTRKCVTCHTNGTYLTMRPLLNEYLGSPSAAQRDFAVEQLRKQQAEPRENLLKSIAPAQVIYVAAGLAEWDAQSGGKLSPETNEALRLMLSLQQENGTWGSLDCWAPYESDAYHLATVALIAIAAAPGWEAEIQDDELKSQVSKLRSYLRETLPPHDYSRVLLLVTATRSPNLLESDQVNKLVELLRSRQQADGGWSIRTFGEPEQWGRGNRAEKLRSEPDFKTPASDGHMTGLAIVALRSAGVPKEDRQIQQGLAWLKANQRTSGRWWTRSLNTDTHHFITYSGTALPLLALAMCDEIPKVQR